MDPVADEIARRSARALRSISFDERTATYVVSFLVSDWEDDPALPTVTIGINTEERVADAALRGSDAQEARWNFAFWLQGRIDSIGGPEDPGGQAIIDQAFAAADLRRDAGDYSDAALAVARAMTKLFVDACIDAAQHLHDSGVITEVFGRSIPVLVHELEYYEAIAEQNRRANPPGVVDEFCAWIDAM